MSEPQIVPARPRLKIGLGAAAVLVLLGLAIAVLVSVTGSHGKTVVLGTPRPITTVTPSPTSSAGSALYVHVVGAVQHPGLFMLHDGDRVVDAVAASGGFTTAADQTQVNLARLLVDGEQISIPAVGEVVPAPTPGAAGAGGKVNLNSADLTALETLPRVGPALAQRILDWRTAHGRFRSIQDLMSVTGFGQKTFDGLKDRVTV